jgi:hypothetical protein
MFMPATEGDREVSIVPAYAGAIAEGFPSRPAGTRMFIAEGNVLVNEVADGLDATPAERRLPEQRPCDLGKPIGLAIAAAQQEHQGLVGQVFHSVLICLAGDHIRLVRVVHDPIGR